MRLRARPTLLVCLILVSGSRCESEASETQLQVIAHRSRATALSLADVRAIYLKRKRLWDDGQPIIPINREAGSPARERFSRRIFGQGSRRLAGYWNQRYFEAGEFPPATMASDEAIVRFVARTPNALGYVATAGNDAEVAVVLVLEE
jgi:ABC-type phosphate transport system substrate-binding protein